MYAVPENCDSIFTFNSFAFSMYENRGVDPSSICTETFTVAFPGSMGDREMVVVEEVHSVRPR